MGRSKILALIAKFQCQAENSRLLSLFNLQSKLLLQADETLSGETTIDTAAMTTLVNYYRTPVTLMQKS